MRLGSGRGRLVKVGVFGGARWVRHEHGDFHGWVWRERREKWLRKDGVSRKLAVLDGFWCRVR